MFNNNTIAAISTAQGSGGISVIRISGKDAISITDCIFKSNSNKKLADLKGYSATYGSIYNKNQHKIDEAIALVFKAPNSYTGEDVVEISCHGGVYITKSVLRQVIRAGATPAQAGEFTKRAFLNGKVDLTEAESIMDIISAKGKNSARVALLSKEGRISKKIEEICNKLISSAAHLNAWADYPEEDIEQISNSKLLTDLKKTREEMKNLISSYDKGKVIKEGIDTIIVGKPNVGKSTLMNLLSGSEKSIVTDIEGTTRDIIEEVVSVGNIILNLSDTAGLRDTDNPVEKIGVERAKERIQNCGLVLAMFDGSQELSNDDRKLLISLIDIPSIAIINKVDLDSTIDIDFIKHYVKSIVYLSAINGDGIDELVNVIEEVTGTQDYNPSEIVLLTERQRASAIRAYSSIDDAINSLESEMTLDAVTVMIEDAIEELLELTGKKASEEVINQVFSKFCVGK